MDHKALLFLERIANALERANALTEAQWNAAIERDKRQESAYAESVAAQAKQAAIQEEILRDLVKCAKKGDQAAFKEIMSRHFNS